jgi:branched-chain amino acid transport system permease protein
MPFMFALGYGLQKFMLNRVLGDDILPPLLVTFGLSVVLQNALLEGFSADSQRIQTGSLSTASIEVAGSTSASCRC